MPRAEKGSTRGGGLSSRARAARASSQSQSMHAAPRAIATINMHAAPRLFSVGHSLTAHSGKPEPPAPSAPSAYTDIHKIPPPGAVHTNHHVAPTRPADDVRRASVTERVRTRYPHRRRAGARLRAAACRPHRVRAARPRLVGHCARPPVNAQDGHATRRDAVRRATSHSCRAAARRQVSSAAQYQRTC